MLSPAQGNVALRNFTWTVGVLLGLLWLALALVVPAAALLAASMSLMTAAGVGVLWGLIVLALPLSVITYVWSGHAQGIRAWFGNSLFGWIPALVLLVGWKPLLNAAGSSRPVFTAVVWATCLLVAPFYAYVAISHMGRILTALPPPPAILTTLYFWVLALICFGLVQACLLYARRDSRLISASRDGSEGQAKLFLLVGANSNAILKNETPLAAAASRGHEPIVRLLLSAGARVNQAEAWGRTPLFDAARNGRADVCKTLLAAGADPNVIAQGGETPLLYATEGGSLPIVRMLLAAGAAVDQPGGTGWTPFTTAVAIGRFNIAEELVRAGADVNAADWKGTTALHYAAEKSDSKAVSWLLRFGANPRLPNRDGITATDLAARYGDKNVQRPLGVTSPGAD